MLRFGFFPLALFGLSLQTSFEVDVNLVNVFATVQDADGNFVTDLQREDFRIFEDGEERSVEIFETTANISSSVGVLIDNSGSSASMLRSVKAGVEEFSSHLGPEDETFVMSFANKTVIIHELDDDIDRLPGALDSLEAWGTSVLFDALSAGMRKVTGARHEHKALIVLSDGGDNGSVASYRDVVGRSQSEMVLLYFVGIGPRMLIDVYTIQGLASTSGGRVVLLEEGQSVSDALDAIRMELGFQYYLGYHASGQPGFHSIKVEVPDREVAVRARNGYLIQE